MNAPGADSDPAAAPAPAPRASIQTRLLLLVLAFACTVFLGAVLMSWRAAQEEIDELLDGHLKQGAALLLMQANADFDDVLDIPVLQKFAPQVAFQVFMSEQLVTRTENAGTKPMAPLGSGGFFTVTLTDGAPWRVFSTFEEGRGITVQVGEQMASRRAILWAMVRGLAGPALLALPLLGLGLWWSVRAGLAPLRALRLALDARTPHAAEPVVLANLPRDIEPLVQTLNALLARIDGMVQAERRFTADAAHELRTPIAAIRAQAQVAMGAGDDAPGRQHALQATLAGCDRATRLVEQLLTLARLESSQQVQALPVDLAAVARRVAAELAPTALARAQQVGLQADAPCPVAADEVLLGVLVRNLVDNALRYSPDGAQVELRVQPLDGGGALLQVHDSGAGMQDAEIARLGERFYRVLGTERPGSGLGWSIVRRLLQVFGAQVEIGRSAGLGGLSVTVRWPPQAAG